MRLRLARICGTGDVLAEHAAFRCQRPEFFDVVNRCTAVSFALFDDPQLRHLVISGGNNTISTEAGADVGFGRRRNCSTIAAHAALWNLRPAVLIRLLPANAPLLGCRQYVFTLGGKGRISFILSGLSHVASGLHAALRFPHRQAVSG